MPLIDSRHLEAWAVDLDSRGSLPLLIRRLIWASVSNIYHIDFPQGSETWQTSFDGTLHNLDKNNHAFVPQGYSYWEVGTGKPKQKAQEDYDKRTDSNKTDKILVIVNLNQWNERANWRDERIREGYWYNIKVIDATQLAEWISYCPSVETWLAQELRNKTRVKPPPPSKTESLDYFWERWSNYILPEELVISGREKYVKLLNSYLRKSQPDLISIKAPTTEEAIAFFASCVEVLEYEEKIRIKARALIVKGSDIFKELSLTNDFQILIPIIEDDGTINMAFKDKLIIRPFSYYYHNSYDETLELPKLDQDEALKIFKKKLKYNEQESRTLIQETGCEISIIRRQLRIERRMPKWAEGNNTREVIPALLLGQWDEYFDGDKKIIATLSNQTFQEYRSNFLLKWLKEEDFFVTQEDSEWSVVSPVDGFKHLGKDFSPDDIQNFSNCAEHVLEDFKRNGSIKKYSINAKRGILQNLILVADQKEEFAISQISNGQQFVNNLLNKVVSNKGEFEGGDLRKFLPLIAEASPIETLNLINDFIKEKQITIDYFYQFVNSLEIIAFIPENLNDVTNTIATLYIVFDNENFKNSLLDCSEKIFRINNPQTYADYSELLKVLYNLKTDYREFLENLLNRLTHQEMLGNETNNIRPKWRKNVNHRNEEFKDRKAMEYLESLSKLGIEDD
jgi:hypothetical protein